MPLAIGDKLGPYEITALLGEGGMGEVYKARDTRLDRTVALKVSKAQFTDRFEREARAVAALNHPNICQLYDVGPNYLVMEFVEGAALKGPMPLERALEVSYQILDALDAAHKRGITHRDLKPANVLVAKQGIKLLDFGLAKQEVQIAPTDATLTKALTGEGQLLGTLQYMSPEQAQCQNADARSDIFAFGCVFHELITGKRAFSGESVAAVIAAILKDEPAARDVPEAVDRVIKTCLAKDADARFQSAADCKRALQWAVQTQPVVAQKKSWLWSATAAAAVAGLAFLAFKPAPAQQQPDSATFTIEPPEGLSFRPSSVKVSPDGKLLAAILLKDRAETGIWVRALDTLDFVRIPGTEDAAILFWSPDSKSIGFSDGSRIRRVIATGGAIETVATDTGINSATWAPDGSIIYDRSRGPLRIVRAGSQAGEDLMQIDKANGETQHVTPRVLDDGEHMVFRVYATDPNRGGVYVRSIRGGPQTRLPIDPVRSGSFLNPSAIAYGGGYLAFRKGDRVVVQKLDAAKRELVGAAALLSESASLAISLSRNGVLTTFPSAPAQSSGVLTAVNRKGEKLQSYGPPAGSYGHVDLSLDGKTLLADYRDRTTGVSDLWKIDVASGVPSRLTFPPISGSIGTWSGDGSTVIFSARGALYSVPSAAGGNPFKIVDAEAHHKHVSSDGKFVMFEKDRTTAENSQLATVRLDGSAAVELALPGSQFAVDPQFSPDGKWFAYAAGQSQRREIFVESFPPGKGKWQISRGHGIMPRWRADGKELFYYGDGWLTAVPLTLTPTGVLQPGAPTRLFELKNSGGEAARFAVSADGQRFYYSATPDTVTAQAPLPVTITLNWSPR